MFWLQARIGVLGAVALIAACQATPAPSFSSTPIIETHTDAEIHRFVEYQGPVRSQAILQIWNEGFLGQRVNRAMAVSKTGSYGTGFGWTDKDDAINAAMESCKTRGEKEGLGTDCQLYAVNEKIVYPGLEYTLPVRHKQVGDLTSRNEYFNYGPNRAKGVIIWSHGTNQPATAACGRDQRIASAWAFINRFNLAGWDVFRLDRDPCADRPDLMLESFNQSIPLLRQAGYQKIVLAGQSTGALRSLIELKNDGIRPLIFATLSVSPAFNTRSGAYIYAPGEWKNLIGSLKPGPNVGVIFFDKDTRFNPYAKDEAEYGRSALSANGVANMIIYEDDPQIVSDDGDVKGGHYSAGKAAFTAKYSACLLTFIETGNAVGACRNASGGGT